MQVTNIPQSAEINRMTMNILSPHIGSLIGIHVSVHWSSDSCYTGEVDKVSKQIGQKLSYLRRKNGLSLRQFAEKFQISKGYLSNIEIGKRLPTIEMLSQIAKALGVDLRDFF